MDVRLLDMETVEMGTEHLPVDERTPRAADRWPLVGRQAELELFRQSLADPHRDAFVLVGPAGVGKTRLADECLARAAADGLVVARAVATVAAASIPLGALIHLLPPTDSAAGRGADSLRRTTLGPVGSLVGHPRKVE